MTRKEFYDLVWSKPVFKILEDFDISNRMFKSICKDYDIPVPPNGYWSKLRHNANLEIIELPENSNDGIITIESYISANLNTPQAQLSHLRKLLLKESNLNFEVHNPISKPDKLIVEAKRGMQEYTKARGFLGDGIVSTMENQLSISVAKENIPRALCFMDALVKLIKQRGHAIEVNGSTNIIVNKQVIKVRFREIMKREQYPKYSWITKMPSGILSFRFDCRNYVEWRDSEKRPLESRLVDILAKLELVSKEMEAYQIKLEKGWKEQRIRREIEERFIAKRKEELEAFKSVINNSSRWQKSIDLRNYLETVQANAVKKGTLTDELNQWLKWINDKADWYDPLIEKEDALFENVDRDTLTVKGCWN